MHDDCRTQLSDKYKQWANEIKDNCPDFLSERYSNPYYCGISKYWFASDRPRILVVGEEGFGMYGCGKRWEDKRYCYTFDDIEKIQELNSGFLDKQLGVGEKEI